MSCVDVREADLASPLRARSLFTVAAAISFARLVERPSFFSESLMCSYCRSRFALHDLGIWVRPPGGFLGGQQLPVTSGNYSRRRRMSRYSSGGFWTLCSVAYLSVSSSTTL